MKAYEISEILENKFPLHLAESWDNVGFMLGRVDKEINKILVSLDVTDFVVDEAIENNVDMIISHHPLIFTGLKKITTDTPEGRRLLHLIRNDITVYSAHTNLDCANGGINDRLAQLFHLSDVKTINVNDYGCGLGRIGYLNDALTAEEFANQACLILDTDVRLTGNMSKMVKCIAVASGACDDIIPDSIKMGADLVLTGDCKYHRNLDFSANDIVIIDAGHYPTEIICMDIFAQELVQYGINIIKSKEKDVFTYIRKD